MGRFVNPENSAFLNALNSEIYVDKTGLISYTNKVLETQQAFICNSRPRRFGKSMAANMLAAYYSKGCDSRSMFENLEIGKNPQFDDFLNGYDTIHIDMQWFLTEAGSPAGMVEYLSKVILAELSEEFPDMIAFETKTVANALSQINAVTGKKFVIIIDEWDVLIRDESSNEEIQEEYINFLRGLFKGVEPTKYIALAYLTGILPVKKQQTQSALNNFDEFTMVEPDMFAPYIGFTEDEVKELCQKYECDFDEVKRWYDGYTLGNYQIYNPRAVVSVMLRGNFRSYWTQTGSYESIQPYIRRNFDGLKNTIIEMLAGNPAHVEVRTFQNDFAGIVNKDDVVTLLIHLGYLGYYEKKKLAYIPNEEIRQEFELTLNQNKWTELQEFQEASEMLLDSVLEENPEEVANAIEKIHNQFASSIQYNNENSLSSVLTIAFLNSMEYYFMPIREMPAGRGFADFVYLPKPDYLDEYPALIVELKWNKSSVTALDQIKERKYTESLKRYTGNILMVGINYDKKTKKHECIIEKMTKES